MTFSEAMQKIVNLSDREKVKLAGDSFVSLMPHLMAIDKDHKGLGLFLPIVGASAGADGKLNNREIALILAITKSIGMDLTEEQVLEIVKSSTRQETYDMMRSLSNVLVDDGRPALINLVASLCAIDDAMSKEELGLIASLLD